MVNKESKMSATAPREKTFLLARPEQRLLEAIARRVPRRLAPDHFTGLALARRDRVRRRGGHGALLARGRAARGALARRLARRHARARPPRRAPALRLLPRPPRRRRRDRADRPRARALRPHAPVDRARARDRLPRPVDQLLPGDAGAGPVLARLRAARADRGAARPDRAAGGRRRGRTLSFARARAARHRRPGRRRRSWAWRSSCERCGNLRVLAAREPYTAP